MARGSLKSLRVEGAETHQSSALLITHENQRDPPGLDSCIDHDQHREHCLHVHRGRIEYTGGHVLLKGFDCKCFGAIGTCRETQSTSAS